MVGLMLTAVLATWLCVVGPPNFKEWQTLIASCIALVGGALAYRGAMAKVEFDREVAAKNAARTKVGVYLRLEASLRLLEIETSYRLGILEERLATEQKFHTASAQIECPKELDEAWQELHLFPTGIAQRIANIRGAIRNLELFVKTAPPDYMIVIPPEGQEFPRQTEVVLSNLRNTKKFALQVSNLVGKLVTQSVE
jgi:hypothetical protein